MPSDPTLADHALALPPDERVTLANKLLSSLDPGELSADDLIELDRRRDALRAHPEQALTREQVADYLAARRRTRRQAMR